MRANRALNYLARYDYVTAEDPLDGNYKEFKIAGIYRDFHTFSEGLRLQREDGGDFPAPLSTIKQSTKRMEGEK